MKYVWSIYIGLLLGLGFVRMGQKILTETGGFGSRYGPLILAAILALGVFGAVFQKPLARRWVWKAVFWLLAISSVGLFVLAVYVLSGGAYQPAGLILGILVVLLPGQWQLFGYVYRSSSLWGTAPAKSRNTDGREAPAG